jgi:hypothetical protein
MTRSGVLKAVLPLLAQPAAGGRTARSGNTPAHSVEELACIMLERERVPQHLRRAPTAGQLALEGSA